MTNCMNELYTNYIMYNKAKRPGQLIGPFDYLMNKLIFYSNNKQRI